MSNSEPGISVVVVDMRLPTWDEVRSDREQLDVLEAKLDQSLFVVGPPGCGKTSLAVWRADALAGLHGTTPVVTYNRMLRRTLQLVANEHHIDIQASTMHSYVWSHYYRRATTEPPTRELDSYNYEWNTMLTRLNGLAPDQEALVVDEGQDLPSGFFAYASRHIAMTMSVFADEEQAIDLAGSTLEQIRIAAALPLPVMLTENHRNTPEIARLAEHFHQGRLPAATVVRSDTGGIPHLIRSRSPESTIDRIVNEFRNRSGSVGVIVAREATGQLVHESLTARLPDTRVNRYASELKNENSIDVRTPGITILNKRSVKGQEFDTVFILELEEYIPCSCDADFRAMYMMCARARDHLFLVYGPNSLTADAAAALPGSDVLER